MRGQPKRTPVHPTFGYNRAPHVKPSPNLEPDMDSQTVERRAQHQPRLEDDPLVRGLGRYAADAPMSGETQAYFVRSPHAFADIRSIDTTAAKAAAGVLCVLTAADMEGIGNVSQHPPLAGRGGQKLIVPQRPATSRWTGPDWRRTRTPMRARSIASSHLRRTWRALPSSIKGSWCNRWNRAARPRATIRRTTATTCAAARKARARYATGLLPSWASPTSACGSSPRTSAVRSG